jgi:hypothetical protein
MLKLPQKGNDGSNRGTICHSIYELLGQEKHQNHYNKIIQSGTIKGSDAVSRLIRNHAKKLKVSDDENMDLIDTMTVRGLLYDFFGQDLDEPEEAISEKAFDIEINDGAKQYKIRGFIDKLFLYSKEKKAIIRDFKTSKQVFKGKEITDNLQNLIYCLAVRHLYPGHSDVDVEFIFVKFDLEKDLLGEPGRGVLRMEKISPEELDGFEYQLTAIQEYLENFSEEDATSDYAANQGYPSDGTFGGPLMCGKDGFKQSRGEFVLDKAGEKILSYICEFRKPMDFHVLLSKEGKVIKSAHDGNEKDLMPNRGEGETVERRSYSGCPHFYTDAFDL